MTSWAGGILFEKIAFWVTFWAKPDQTTRRPDGQTTRPGLEAADGSHSLYA